MYYARLELPTSNSWLDGVSNRFDSDQASEQYPFLGQVPRMREWIGGRAAKGLRSNSLTIKNKHYESTLEIALRDLRRDKTAQLQTRIDEFAGEGEAHWHDLVSDLIIAAPSAVCYDGQYFFDTDHSEGDSGTQDNDISVDISALPCVAHGSTTAPSVEEMQQAVIKGIAQIMGFKDDQGRLMNRGANRFLVTVPLSLWVTAVAAFSQTTLAAVQTNANPNALSGLLKGMTIDVQCIPELTWTASFAVWRTDSAIKGLIRQEETGTTIKMKDEQSEFAFDNDAIQIGIDAWRGADYGLWQRACYVTMA